MDFKKFTILNASSSHQGQEEIDILINPSHIVSIKPIKMTTTDLRVIEGYWIRLTNGKKYKAIKIPDSIKDVFSEHLPNAQYADTDTYSEGLH